MLDSAILAHHAPRPRRAAGRARGAMRLTAAALGEAYGILRSGRKHDKAGLARHLLRMRAKHLLGKLLPRWQSHTETIWGRKLECFNHYDLMCTFEVLFLSGDYRFSPPTARPRILDCGSNIGLSLLYFKREYPQAAITAFEPDPVTFALLRRNVLHNGLKDVALHNLALGSTPGPREFFHDPEKPGSVCMSFVPQSVVPASEQVLVARLSDFVDGEFDFLKLDVEGAELEVIEDLAARGKLRLIREMAIEVHPGLSKGSDEFSRLETLLEDAGFRWEIRSGSPEDGGNFTIHAERNGAGATAQGERGGAG
jgi:FkbM family methyltransferase